MNEILRLLAELKDSNESILALTRGTRKVSDEEIGIINNHACDVGHFAGKIEALLGWSQVETSVESPPQT